MVRFALQRRVDGVAQLPMLVGLEVLQKPVYRRMISLTDSDAAGRSRSVATIDRASTPDASPTVATTRAARSSWTSKALAADSALSYGLGPDVRPGRRIDQSHAQPRRCTGQAHGAVEEVAGPDRLGGVCICGLSARLVGLD